MTIFEGKRLAERELQKVRPAANRAYYCITGEGAALMCDREETALIECGKYYAFRLDVDAQFNVITTLL